MLFLTIDFEIVKLRVYLRQEQEIRFIMQEKHVHDLRNKKTEFKTEMNMNNAQLTERMENSKKFQDESSFFVSKWQC